MIGRLGCVIGVTAVVTALSASPAVADELGLSPDGVGWSASLVDPLFDSSVRWVPGDSRTSVFYVRNEGDTRGDLTIDVLGSNADELVESGDLLITARGGGGTWQTVSRPGTHRLLTSPDIPMGGVAEIQVNVTLDDTSRNGTRQALAPLTLRATLAESLPDPTPAPTERPSDADESPTAALPDTGGPSHLWLGGVGAVFVGIGLALTRSRRDDEVEVRDG